jgi:DNA-formamidopyrimidine glycosylase
LVDFVAEQATGKVIARVDVSALNALKTYDPPIDALKGGTVGGTGRRGKFLLIRVEPLWLVIHLARAGWLKWRDAVATGPIKRGKNPLALRVRFDDGSGFEVTEQGHEKRLAIYVVRDPEEVEGISKLGIDVFDPAFTVDAFSELLAGSGAQIKGVLTDQEVIAGVGNAYSDEALHIARLSPFKPAGKLTPDEVRELHSALVSVMRDALERSTGLPAAGLKSEKKSGMRVHGRTGQQCPECGDTVREVSFATKSLQYCPTCQTGGKPLADRRLSKLLK